MDDDMNGIGSTPRQEGVQRLRKAANGEHGKYQEHRKRPQKGPHQGKSLETEIGLYWLHRLGIVTLVVGMVFLITYSFQFFGPALKLLSGALVSAILLVIGSRMSSNEKQQWFGHGLTAGGWSLAYFTAYAAYYIPSVQIINSLPLETALLSLVATGSLLSALRARSELMAIYSVTLAALTILIDGPGLFSDVSFVIIAILAAVLGNLRSWRKLFAYALAACYVGHFCCSFEVLQTAQTADNLIAASFLGSLWLVFTAGIGVSTKVPENARNYTTVLACLNACMFSVGLASLRIASMENLFQGAFVVAGLVYLGLSFWLKRRNQEQLWAVHSLLGLSFVNAAKVMHFSGFDLLSVDVMQIALLAVVGMKFEIKTFRWAAAILSVLFLPIWLVQSQIHLAGEVHLGFHAFEYVRIGLLAASTFAGLAYVHIRKDMSSYFNFYYLITNFMVALIVGRQTYVDWQAMSLVLLAVANYGVALFRKIDDYALLGILPFVTALVFCITHLTEWESAPIAILIAALYLGHAMGRSIAVEDKSGNLQSLQTVFAYSGNLLLTLLLLNNLPHDYVSLGLGVEGISLLIAGFLLKERYFRITGLSVLALLTGKLLFVDMANRDTIERILSFIGAGVTFLLSSYGYARFTRSFEDEDYMEESESDESDGVGVGSSGSTDAVGWQQ